MYINKINFTNKTVPFGGNENISKPTPPKNSSSEDKFLKTGLLSAGGIALLSVAFIAVKKGFFSKSTNSDIVKPKFLYHMTSFKNYKSIKNDQLIKKSNSALGDGVFLFDINDLKNKYPEEVLLRMINWYKGEENKIVLIKIPVPENNNGGFIKWRQIDYGNNHGRIKSTEWNSLEDFCSKEKKILHDEPLEFLYPTSIPTDKINSINIVDVAQIASAKDFWKKFYTQN